MPPTEYIIDTDRQTGATFQERDDGVIVIGFAKLDGSGWERLYKLYPDDTWTDLAYDAQIRKMYDEMPNDNFADILSDTE